LPLLSTRAFDRIGLLCPRLTPAPRPSWISPSSVTDSVTCCGPGGLSSTAFRAQPPDLPPALVLELGFAVICQLAQHARPPIRFLFIGSRLCSPLLSGPVFGRRPCVFLALYLHSVEQGTFTPELSNLFGTAGKRRRKAPAPWSAAQPREMRSSESFKQKRRTQNPYLLSATDGLVPKSRRLFTAVRAARTLGWFAAAAP
jgi:hypothetical protein